MTWSNNYAQGTGFATYQNDQTTSTAIYDNYVTYSNIPWPEIKVIREDQRLHDKGKFFKFESSLEFRTWFARPDVEPREMKARNGFSPRPRRTGYRGSTYTQFGRFRPRARTR